MDTDFKFYEVLIVDGSGWPKNIFLVHATCHSGAVIEALKHIPEGSYIRKVWPEGQMDEEWVSVLNKCGYSTKNW